MELRSCLEGDVARNGNTLMVIWTKSWSIRLVRPLKGSERACSRPKNGQKNNADA